MRAFAIFFLCASASLGTLSIGCASKRRPPRYPPAAEVDAPALTPTPEQAKARADAWAREDAEAERRSAEQGERRAAEAAARAEQDARARAELADNRFVFDGEFQAGSGRCEPTRTLKFRDIKSTARDCERCRCEYSASRSPEGTSWTAECSGGKQGAFTRKLVVSSRRSDTPPANGIASWHATLEQTTRQGGASSTCGYVGWMTDRTGEWRPAATEQDEAGPSYDLPARAH